MGDLPDTSEQRALAVALMRAFGAAESALGRRFAKEQRMHPTDAAAIVEVLDAEAHGVTLTPARLAERVGLTPGATSSLVNRLEHAGHLVRTHQHRDRRVVELHTTRQIHADAEAFFAPIATALDQSLSGVAPDQLELLLDTLRRLLAALEAAASTGRDTR